MATPQVKGKPRGFETVQEYRVFEESVEKELKCLKVCQNFQKRPHQCTPIAEKITQRLPLAAEITCPGSEHSAIVEQAERSLLCSTDNISFPETSAQEVGWIIKKAAEKGTRWREDGTDHSLPRCASDDLWHCPVSQCDIVKSFNNYVSVKRTNMFAKLD